MTPVPEKDRAARRAQTVAMLVVLAAVAAATASELRNGLVWDDFYSIGHGTVLDDPSQLGALFSHPTLYVSTAYVEHANRPVDTYRPVTLVTFMIDAAISGRDPVAYHATNLLAHLACVLLVFSLARRVLPPARAKYAPFAAAWFGLSPLLAEAHVWINGRSDVFCALFGLAAVLAWRAGVARGRARASRFALIGAAGVSFLLAALSKEVILLAWPAILFFPRHDGAADVAGLGPPRGGWRAHLSSLVPFAVATAAYVVMRVAAIGGVRAVGDASQLGAAVARLPVLLFDGLFESVVPTRVYLRSLVDDYAGLGPLALAGFAIALVVLVAWLARARRRVPLLAWSLSWFALTLAPAAVIATMQWPGFGRYLYVPMAGLVIGGTDLLARAIELRPRSARLFRVAALAYLLALGARLFAFTLDFESDETLWGAVIRQDPDAPHAHGYLGIRRSELHRYREAIPELRRASELAPDEVRYLEALAWAYENVGDCAHTNRGRRRRHRALSPRGGGVPHVRRELPRRERPGDDDAPPRELHRRRAEPARLPGRAVTAHDERPAARRPTARRWARSSTPTGTPRSARASRHSSARASTSLHAMSIRRTPRATSAPSAFTLASRSKSESLPSPSRSPSARSVTSGRPGVGPSSQPSLTGSNE